MTDDEKALDWTAQLGRLRVGEDTLEGWTDMQIVKAALYEYAGKAGETSSIEALLRIEAELERLRREHA